MSDSGHRGYLAGGFAYDREHGMVKTDWKDDSDGSEESYIHCSQELRDSEGIGVQ